MMTMRKIQIYIVFLFGFFLLAIPTYARIGVGVATGKINVTEKLKPGIIYNLPPLTVLNTGDEPSDYEVSVSYHEAQKELQPAESWFIFSPKSFHLNPGEAQKIEIKLNLPLKTEPGKYFAYLEGHPLKKSHAGMATIGIAAAAKLYFTIEPANIFYAVYYKIISFYAVYAPWPEWVTIGIVVCLVLFLFKKFFNIEINRKKPVKESKPETDE
jgi:P pilus assembly chaperone PapD